MMSFSFGRKYGPTRLSTKNMTKKGLTIVDLMNYVTKLYEKGYSAIDLMQLIENTLPGTGILETFTNMKKYELLIAFNKIKKAQCDIQPPLKKQNLDASNDTKPTRSDPQIRASKHANAPVVVLDDPDYYKKLEEQKRKREELLKLKEEKRSQRVLELKKNENTNTKTNNNNNEIGESNHDRKTVADTQQKASTFGSRTVVRTNDLINKKVVIVQNLSASKTEKSLQNMSESINCKNKVII